ncbi:hypothetical protein X801_02764, partial [Opisthorchis viverrini]
MRQKLEAQEAKAKLEREKQKRESAQNAVAEQLRREWQRQTEQIEMNAQVARKRHREEQEMLAEQSKAARMGSDTVVKVKWTVADNPEAAACYTKDFLTTCLSEFGEVTAVMLGKRGTALVDFHTPSAAREAVECSERSTVGLPQLPLHISFVSQPSSEADTAPLFGSGYAETAKQTSDRHTMCAGPSVETSKNAEPFRTPTYWTPQKEKLSIIKLIIEESTCLDFVHTDSSLRVSDSNIPLKHTTTGDLLGLQGQHSNSSLEMEAKDEISEQIEPQASP